MVNGDSVRPLWRSGRYLTWLTSDTAAGLAMDVQAFVLPLIVIVLSGDPALGGLVAATGAAARLACTLLGGVIADRHDLRRLMVVGGLSGAGISLLLVLAIAADLGVAVLAGLNALAGVRAGLLGLASDAALKGAVPAEQLPTATAANQGRDAAIAMGGAPLGGMLLAVGPVVAMAATGLSFLLAGLSALGLRGDYRPQRAEGDGGGGSSAWSEVRAGLVWLWGQQVLRRLIVVSMLVNLALSALLATLIYDLGARGVDPARIGLLSTVLGVGMLVGALLAGVVVQRVPSGWVAICGILLVSVAAMVLPFVEGFRPTLLVLGLGILGAPATNAALIGYFMHIVPRAVLGRAMSAVELVTGGMVPLAPLVAGLGLAALGRQPTLVLCGAVALSAALVLLTDRGLRGLPRPADWGAELDGVEGAGVVSGGAGRR